MANTTSIQSGSDLTGTSYIFVKLDSNKHIVAAGADEAAIGIMQDSSPQIGELGNVVLDGPCKVKLGGTVSANGFLKVGTSGKAVASAPGDTYLGAQALQDGVSGDIIDCKFVGSVLDGSGMDGVDGPASATDNAVARFNGTTGKLIQNSGATLDDSGVLTATTITATDHMVSPYILTSDMVAASGPATVRTADTGGASAGINLTSGNGNAGSGNITLTTGNTDGGTPGDINLTSGHSSGNVYGNVNSNATIKVTEGSPSAASYNPAVPHILLNSENSNESAYIVRTEGDNTVEGAFGTYGATSFKQVFIGAISDTPIVLYNAGSNNHMIVGTGTDGNETHIMGDHSANAAIRAPQSSALTVFVDSSGNLTHGLKVVDDNSVLKASIDIDGNVSGATLSADNGASGSFTTADAKTVTVVNGIITSIV